MIMKTLQLSLALAAVLAGTSGGLAQGTAFTYQGRLDDGLNPANGIYDLTFALFDQASGGAQQGGVIINSATTISNGLFAVSLDFGNQFPGANRWLEISVRTNGGGAFSTLSPRQAITVAPYAVTAGNITGSVNGGLITPGSVPDASLSANIALRSGGNPFVGNQTVSGGKVGIGITSPTAKLQVGYTNSGVGVFVGDRFPFGTAAFETDLTTPSTHAWFAENGTNVFNVSGGGAGYFRGSVTADGAGYFGGNFGVGSFYSDTTLSIKTRPSDTAALYVEKPGTLLMALYTNGQLSVAGPVYSAGFNGDGANLTGLNAANVSVGMLSDLRLSANIARRSSSNTFNGEQTINGILNLNTPSYPGVTAFIRARPGDNLPLAVQGTNGVNFLLVATNGTSISGNLTVSSNASISGEIFANAITLTGGADLAEPFHMSDGEIAKGSVVVIDERNPGQLRMSSQAYDSRVAGVISGANGINPGLSLSQKGVLEGGQQVALSGRVYVRADASYAAIRAGDLLTTSQTPGFAMKVSDHAKATGAVLGKAMSNLEAGQGFVLVLVSLQ